MDGANCTVDPVVEKTIKDFQAAGKPQAFCCIAPVLAAKVIPGVKVTLGQDKGERFQFLYNGFFFTTKIISCRERLCTRTICLHNPINIFDSYKRLY